MVEYKVLADDPQNGLIIQGDFIPGSTPVNIPHSDPKRKEYISLFLNLRDIDAGIDYLQCISLNNHPRINEGLFISALAAFAKCFGKSNARISLKRATFKGRFPQFADLFDDYISWRNKHFIHDDGLMTSATAFLLVTPNEYNDIFGGPPSVIWRIKPIDYIEESRRLENLLQVVRGYIIDDIDKLGDSIDEEYHRYSREQLLAFDEPELQLISTWKNNDSGRTAKCASTTSRLSPN